MPPPAPLVQAAAPRAAKPEAKPAKQIAAAKPAKSGKQTKSGAAKRSAAKTEVALASASKPSRAAKPAREVVIEEIAAAEPTIIENGAEADEAETPQTQLTPVAKLPKRTIAKGPQWRAAGTLVAAEPSQTIEKKEADELSPVHPASWETTARPAPAASIEEAEYEQEEPADNEAVEAEEEAPSGPSRVRIVGMSGG